VVTYVFKWSFYQLKILVFDEIKYEYYIDHEEFIDYIFDHWSFMFLNGHFISWGWDNWQQNRNIVGKHPERRNNFFASRS
jgi:hypothetical protein